MKKIMIFVLAAALATFAESWPGQVGQVAYAAPVAGHVGGGHVGGGGHFGGGGRGGFRGGHGGFRGGHGGGHFEGGIWFGPGWWWDPFFYPYYPSYPYYPYYNQPSVVIQQQPQEYVMPETRPDESSYWYYCRNPKGYYPYVKRCPGGWLKVVPAPAPPGEEE